MTNLVAPEIYRVEHPKYYSIDLETAIEEFRIDVSKYYTAGFKYNQILKNEKLAKACGYLIKRFLPENEGHSKFPFFKRFVDYVYTRDECHNPFGKWYRFRFFEPLQILEYANYLKKSSGKKRIE